MHLLLATLWPAKVVELGEVYKGLYPSP